eukprot:CAMPEP_0185734404 /NCGR_PEP_ID=MMETSP1171-20130828/22399_1 /TAXON_ID=374046 /ORGANISM="Helicotheca tamensis, Strain CCMP826" /LENGTH=290 /DNA_ID=CAMNT_0028404395 /DNA_START=197 /DNA_END=1066 /DNA_ORIENTATION=+
MSTAKISTLLASPALKWAAGGWTFFILENLILSENRTYLITKLGDDGYHYFYGALSTTAMGTVGYAYLRKVRAAAPLLWNVGGPVPRGAMMASFALNALGLGMASQSFPKLQIPVALVNVSAEESDGGAAPSVMGPSSPQQVATATAPSRAWKVRCPFDFTDSRAQTGTNDSGTGAADIHGLDRITRHPGLWAFGILGLGNALLVPSLPQRVWLSMPLMVAWIGGAHTDSRHRRGMGGQLRPELDSVTSNVPFWAMLNGSQGNVGKALMDFGGEVKGLNAAIATGAAAMW